MPTMRFVVLFCFLTFSNCSRASPERGISGDHAKRRVMTDSMNDEGDDPYGLDLRGFKTSKKQGRVDVPIHAVKGQQNSASEDYNYEEGKGGGKGYSRSSKKGKAEGSKISKKSKSSKKQISKKLKDSSYEDDDYYYHEDTLAPSKAPIMSGGNVTMPPGMPGNQSMTTMPGNQSMVAMPERPDLGGFVPDSTFSARNAPRVDPTPVFPRTHQTTNSNTEDITFDFPLIQRTLYPGPVQLKSHSSVDISEHETEVFEILQYVLTPYLRENVGPILKRYNLKVEYSPGPDTSHLGVIVTNIDLTCNLVIESASKHDLESISHETAKQWIRDFFDGPELFGLLGDLRQNGIDVNEIVFLEDEFQSGLFNGNIAASVTTTGSQKSTPEFQTDPKSRVGLIAVLFVGMFVATVALLIHYKGKFSSQILSSIRSFGSDLDSQTSDGEEKEGLQNRVRTWSGSFRRHPPGGIKPAALQKQPAFSSDYLKEPSVEDASSNDNLEHTLTFHDDLSYSVAGGDYNVPAEYDFKASPIPEAPSPGGAAFKQKSYQEEEFSMPDDYNTVNDEYSLYSNTVKGQRTPSRQHGSRKSPRASPGVNPFDYGTPQRRRGGQHGSTSPFGSPGGSSRPSPNSSYRPSPNSYKPSPGSVRNVNSFVSPQTNPFMDEWSVDSYKTPSPQSKQLEEEIPYRDWHDAPSSSNRRSQLAMPPLK